MTLPRRIKVAGDGTKTSRARLIWDFRLDTPGWCLGLDAAAAIL